MTVLALGAHPDDIELGCGGTLARLAAAGALIRVAVFTRGEAGCAPSVDRHAEAREALATLGVREMALLDLGDTRLMGRVPEMAEAIAGMLRTEPRIIYVPMAAGHQDHQAVRLATDIALRGQGRRCTVLAYAPAAGDGRFAPQLFEELTPDLLAVKCRAAGAHRSQAERTYVTRDCIEVRARFHAYQAGLPGGLAEGFEVVRLMNGGVFHGQ